MNKKIQFILAIIFSLTFFDLKAGCFLPFDTIKFKSCLPVNEVCFSGLEQDVARTLEIFVNKQKYTGILGGCDNDPNLQYLLNQIIPIGPYFLKDWTIKNILTGVSTSYSGNFKDFNALTDSLNKWDPQGNWTYFDNIRKITGGELNKNIYSNLVIDEIASGINNKIVIPNTYLIPKSTSLFLNSGFNQVILNGASCSDTIYVIINCTTPEIVNRTVIIGQSDTICLNFSQLSGKFSTIENICKNKSGTNIEFSTTKNDSCIVAKALKNSTDTACYVICDDFGFCDTTFFYVTGKSLVGTSFVYDTITKEIWDTLCISTKYLPGKPVSISNICSSAGNFSVNFKIDSLSNCVYATGLTFGTDTACIVICDDKGFCDTTKWVVTTLDTKDINVFYDTLYLNQKVDTCIGTKFTKSITAVNNLCPQNSGNDVVIDVTQSNSLCQNSVGKNISISYTAKNIGIDSACVEVVTSDGRRDTILVYITVLPINKTIIKDTIVNGITKKLVLSTTKLSGNIQSIKNSCTVNGKYVEFSQDVINKFCIYAKSKDIGIDTSCWVICDSSNSCDTIVWIVNVIKSSLKRPVAIDDTDTVTIGSSKMILVLNNDLIDGTLKKFAFQTLVQGGVGPLYGVVMLDTIGNLLYNPTTSDCNKLDFFKYIICNEAGCDTALVTIYLKCKEEVKPFLIYNAFSPNGDDVNDVFKIDGIETYPNHTLYIYNRWGQEVVRTKNYQNDWTGTWKSDILPDGTYFYVFDTGKGDIFKGYLELRR
ncbi:MAG: gliding motility-associated C-terminal domain-containing protein [Saprospiraceae bacterium]|nr:gliding motility-associated C-terminal domain-containing protein [Saprospiraceae bacterium]